MNNLSHLFTDTEPSLLDTTPQNPVFRWVTVASLSPLQIQLDYTTAPLAARPCSLIADLKVGDRVWAMLVNKKIVILGRSGGDPAPSGPDSTGFTVAAGWSLSVFRTVKTGSLMSLILIVERTGGTITVNSKGDITNIDLGTLAVGKRPVDWSGLHSYVTGRVATGGVSPGGVIQLAAVGGTTDIVNGESISLSGVIIVA